ncbi:MAG: 3-coathanger stack domain-containing protein [Bacteroidota bacterium]
MILACLSVGLYQYYPSSSTVSFTAEVNPSASEEGEMDKLAANLERIQQEFDKIKDPATNKVPVNGLLNARALLQNIIDINPVIEGVNWVERGPNNVAGRTRTVHFDVRDNTNNTVYAGSVGGGLWRTTNFQDNVPTWIEVDPFFGNLAITAMVQDPTNPDILYFGTGEGWFNFDAIRGLGIWKSTNGGTTWAQLPATNNVDFHYVMDLLVDSNGNLYAATRNGGLRRSTDDGLTWNQVLGTTIGVGTSNRAADLEIGADGTIYASLGVFNTGSVYSSATGAVNTWSAITPSGNWERIEIATAPSDANRLYLLCQGAGSFDATGMFRSNDQGASWTNLSANIPTICDQGQNSTFTRSQAWYDLIATVNPTNPDQVYIAGVDALRSDDGGNNWTQISNWTGNFFPCGSTAPSYVHADHHSIDFEPGSSTKMVIGSDGGIAHTTNATAALPQFIIKNTGYNVTQYYACAIHPTRDFDYFLAGAQDNGSQKFTMAGLNNTTDASGGDGAFCHIDQDNPNIQITSFVRNNYFVSTDGGNSFSQAFFSNTGGFINPTDYDDTGNRLYARFNTGRYFRWDNPGFNNSASTVVASNLGTVTHVAVSPNVANRVYFGDSAGKVVQIDDAHTNTNKAGTILLDVVGSVSAIAIEEGNEDHMLVSFSNYGVISVYETTDGGTNWTDIEGNLPDMPIRWIIFNPADNDQAFVATELGVWSTDDIDGASTVWEVTNTGLANVRVDMLQYRRADSLIAAATHGRGLFTAVGYGAPSCLATLNINDLNIASDTYQASDQINSAGTVPSGNDVTFDAANTIQLTSGFQAESGSMFTASVGGGCAAALLPSNTALEETRATIEPLSELKERKDVDFFIYPSPASGTVTVDFLVNQETETTITLHNSMGKLVRTLQANTVMAAEPQRLTFNAGDLQGGLYYVVISTPQARRSQKLMVVR